MSTRHHADITSSEQHTHIHKVKYLSLKVIILKRRSNAMITISCVDQLCTTKYFRDNIELRGSPSPSLLTHQGMIFLWHNTNKPNQEASIRSDVVVYL